MNSTDTMQTFALGRWRVAHKITGVSLIIGTLCFSVVMAIAMIVALSTVNSLGKSDYQQMANMLSAEIADAVRWKKTTPLDTLFDRLATSNQESALVGLSVENIANDSGSKFTYNRKIDGLVDPELDQLFANSGKMVDAIESTETKANYLISMPLYNKKTGQQLGMLISAWDLTRQQAVAHHMLKNVLLTAAGIFPIYALLIFWFTNRTIARRIKGNVKVANRVAAGDLEGEIVITGSDELSELDNALREMQQSLRASDDSERRAKEFGRIKQALDAATSSTVLVNEGLEIVYVNDAAVRLFSHLQDLFGADSANHLVGQPVSLLNRVAELDDSRVDAMRSSEVHEVSVNGHSLRINMSPVKDDMGQRIGTVFEWVNRTSQVEAETQLQVMVDAATKGDFTQRINDEAMTGFYARVAGNLNLLAEISEVGLNDILRVLKALASGDLTERIEKDYQGIFGDLKENCNATTEKLMHVVQQIRLAAGQVNRGASEISMGNLDLSKRTEEQGGNLETTSSAMLQITTAVQHNSENAKDATQLAEQAHEEASRGGEVAKKAMLAVNEISIASGKIADINGVIDEIAFQTNLLALNASVEAARAGELGRGFAVVASEVRNLAGRSSQAAKEIKQLIEDSSAKVSEGERLVRDSGTVLDTLVHSVQKVSVIVKDISTASNEQSIGISQINQSISYLDDMTQQNTALVEEAAAASQSLGSQAHQLEELVNFFNTEFETSNRQEMYITAKAS